MQEFGTENMQDWMRDLPDTVKNLSIIFLAIPGSHNSITYAINRHSKIAPDADESVRKIYPIFPMFVRRWAKTQSANAITQLNLGVRYFDLRICLKNKQDFFYAHGVYCCEVFHVLKEIDNFLNEHPNEFIILDFQHFYGLTLEDHRIFQNRIQSIFGNKCYSRLDGTLMRCTLKFTQENNKQILAIYRDCNVVPKIFWESSSWPTPWPNTCSVKRLEKFLEKHLVCRTPYTGYVSQCIITPSSRYITIRFFLSLKACVKRVNKKLKPWIQAQTCGSFEIGDRPRSNVFLGDFIDINNGDFCKNVIALNYKICDCCKE